MIHIHPRDIRIIRLLGYTKPLGILLENETSFYNVILDGVLSYNHWERKYNTSDRSGRSKYKSEKAMHRKILTYFKNQKVESIIPPLCWEDYEEIPAESVEEEFEMYFYSKNAISTFIKHYSIEDFNKLVKAIGKKTDGSFCTIYQHPVKLSSELNSEF